MPEGPSVAGGRVLDDCSDLVDRPLDLVQAVLQAQGAIGVDGGGVLFLGISQYRPCREETLLDQGTEGNARLFAFGVGFHELVLERLDVLDAFLGEGGVASIAFDADIFAPQFFGDRAGRSRSEEGVEDHVVFPC